MHIWTFQEYYISRPFRFAKVIESVERLSKILFTELGSWGLSSKLPCGYLQSWKVRSVKSLPFYSNFIVHNLSYLNLSWPADPRPTNLNKLRWIWTLLLVQHCVSFLRQLCFFSSLPIIWGPFAINHHEICETYTNIFSFSSFTKNFSFEVVFKL